MVVIQSAAAEIRRGKKKEEVKRKKQQGKNIMACPIPHGGHNYPGDKSAFKIKQISLMNYSL